MLVWPFTYLLKKCEIISYYTQRNWISFSFIEQFTFNTPKHAFISWKNKKKNEAEELKLHHLYKLFPFKIISHVSVATITMAFLFFSERTTSNLLSSKCAWEMGVIDSDLQQLNRNHAQHSVCRYFKAIILNATRIPCLFPLSITLVWWRSLTRWH